MDDDDALFWVEKRRAEKPARAAIHRVHVLRHRQQSEENWRGKSSRDELELANANAKGIRPARELKYLRESKFLSLQQYGSDRADTWESESVKCVRTRKIERWVDERRRYTENWERSFGLLLCGGVRCCSLLILLKGREFAGSRGVALIRCTWLLSTLWI